MTIEYKIDENDFLTYQLFIATKSDRIRKKRKKNKLIVPLIYVAFGLLFYFMDILPLTFLFIISGLLWYFIYPLWERRHYVKHYKGFIKENHKDRIDRITTLEFSNDFILGKGNGSESKIMTTEIKVINEIPSAIFVRLKGGQSIILPKDKISNIDNLTTRLKELATYLKIKYDKDEKWEWK